MTTTEKLTLPYGCNRALPAGCRVAWGARLIAPDDLLHDRQGCEGGDEGGDERLALLEWLGSGAGDAAREKAREMRLGMAGAALGLDGRSQGMVSLFSDERGEVMGSPQASYCYVYIAAWLFEHVGEPPAKLVDYFDASAKVAQTFMPGRGWRVLTEQPAATSMLLRALKGAGVTHVGVTADGEEHRVADFPLAELGL